MSRNSETLELDLSRVEPSISGPRRPQDRVALSQAKQSFQAALPTLLAPRASEAAANAAGLKHGSIVIAAGLLARNAVARGLKRKPWVKTSLAPGSRVVTEYSSRNA